MLGQVLPSLVAPIGFNWQISITLVPGLATREVAVAALGTVCAMSSADSTVATQLTSVIAAGWPRATAFSLFAWYVFAPQCTSLNKHGFCPVTLPPASTGTESAASGSRRENPVPASTPCVSKTWEMPRATPRRDHASDAHLCHVKPWTAENA
jgi:hypothetical protein